MDAQDADDAEEGGRAVYAGPRRQGHRLHGRGHQDNPEGLLLRRQGPGCLLLRRAERAAQRQRVSERAVVLNLK